MLIDILKRSPADVPVGLKEATGFGPARLICWPASCWWSGKVDAELILLGRCRLGRASAVGEFRGDSRDSNGRTSPVEACVVLEAADFVEAGWAEGCDSRFGSPRDGSGDDHFDQLGDPLAVRLGGKELPAG